MPVSTKFSTGDTDYPTKLNQMDDDLNLGTGVLQTAVTGNALIVGAQYFNTTINKLKVYTTGLAWAALQDGISSVAADTSPQLGGNLDLNNFDVPISPTQQAAIDNSIGLSIVFGGF